MKHTINSSARLTTSAANGFNNAANQSVNCTIGDVAHRINLKHDAKCKKPRANAADELKYRTTKAIT